MQVFRVQVEFFRKSNQYKGYGTYSGSENRTTGGQVNINIGNHKHTTNIPSFNSGNQSQSHTHSINLPNFTGSSGNGGFANTPTKQRTQKHFCGLGYPHQIKKD